MDEHHVTEEVNPLVLTIICTSTFCRVGITLAAGMFEAASEYIGQTGAE